MTQKSYPYLLNTIKLPKNLKYLKQKLPRSNYLSSIETQQNDDYNVMKRKITLPPVFNRINHKQNKDKVINASAIHISDELNLPNIINNNVDSVIYNNNYHHLNKRLKEHKSISISPGRYCSQIPSNLFNMDEKLFNVKPKIIEPILMKMKEQLMIHRKKQIYSRQSQIYGYDNCRIGINQNSQKIKGYNDFSNRPKPKIGFSRPIWWG